MDDDSKRFPTSLKCWKYEIERLAKKNGLTFPPTVYELVSMDEMSEIVALHGFPTMPHHWRQGQESLRMKKSQKYGLARFYELVIGTFPAYGYLMDSNDRVTQKAVMAHVCGHGHMFKNNVFNQTMNPDMLNVFANDALRYEQYCETYGRQKVRGFYDWALSLEFLIDHDALFLRRFPGRLTEEERRKKFEERKGRARIEPRYELPYYMEDFFNPRDWVEGQERKREEELEDEIAIEKGLKIPVHPQKDVLLFLIRYGPLEDWQREVLAMMRRQSYYFATVIRTKFMHEGLSALFEERILNEPHLMMGKCDLSIFAQQMAGVQHKSPMNPYKLAYDLWKDIQFRWNTGRHGEVWEQCDVQDIRENWDMFVVFKNIYEECRVNHEEFCRRWNEFLAFRQALIDGELGWPKEFFIRDFFTAEILIPAWCDYQKAEAEQKVFSDRLRQMEIFEKDFDSYFKEVQSGHSDDSTEEELFFEARRNLYRDLDLLDSEFYLWTIPEVKRQLVYYKKLLSFRRKFSRRQVEIPPFYIPESWFHYTDEFRGEIELGVGLKKIFETASYYDDFVFMEEFFTKEFCEENKYFLAKQKKVWDWDIYTAHDHWVFETRAFERIRRYFLFRFTNFYMPVVKVEDANHNNNNELYLKHYHSGVDLDYWSKDGMYVKDVLERLFRIWGGDKPVHLETIASKKEEEIQWWYYWYETEEKEGGEQEQIKGTRRLFTWSKKGFSSKDLGEVTFQAPF